MEIYWMAAILVTAAGIGLVVFLYAALVLSGRISEWEEARDDDEARKEHSPR